MFIKSTINNLAAAIFYAALVTLLGRHFQPEFLFFWLGVIGGVFVLYFDPLFTAYFGSAITSSTQEIKQLIEQKKFPAAVGKIFVEHKTQEQPILHSAFLQCILMLLSFYVITSSGSLLGSGLIMGMVIHLLQEEIAIWRKDPQRLTRILFWNIHREVSFQEQKIYLAVVFAVFFTESILLI
ncbi:MAG: hypothetical protein Q8Q15_00440 [bacterium]|nr:hypothetical protein [bacterium]